MRWILSVLAITVAQLLCASWTEAQQCPQLLTEYNTLLPATITNRNWVGIINLITAITLRYREAAKVPPVQDLDVSMVAVRNVAVTAGLDATKQVEFNGRYLAARTRLMSDYDKVFFDLAAKNIRSVSQRDPALTDFVALFTATDADCTIARTDAAAANTVARTELTAMLTEASSTLTAPPSLRTNVFIRGQFLLNNRLFDAVSPQIETVVATTLQQYVAQLMNRLKFIADSLIMRCDLANAVDKETKKTTVRNALASFAVSTDYQTEATTILTTPKVALDRDITAMRAIVNPFLLQSSVLTTMSRYSDEVNTAFNTYLSGPGAGAGAAAARPNTEYNRVLALMNAVVP